jgi:multimeric flavodoxin WrbA
MRSLILDGIIELEENTRKIQNIIEQRLKQNNFHVNHVQLKDKKVTPCQGCFDCWVKTPGICRIDDYGRTIVRQIVQSDLVIYLTPITFGGYSSEIKKVMDRSIPILLPFFNTIEGETHHKQRYDERPCIIVIGYQKEKNKKLEETFKQLVHRNSLNFEAPVYECLTFYTNQGLTQIQSNFENILKEVKAYYE